MRSLFEAAGKIDIEYIKKSYELIMTDKKLNSFEESWEIILTKFKDLDQNLVDKFKRLLKTTRNSATQAKLTKADLSYAIKKARE